MKRVFWVFALTGSILVSLLIAGGAAAAVFDMGAGSSIDVSATNPVLRLDIATINPDLDGYVFDLGVGESFRFLFATIGTTETWINSDDVNPGSVTALVDFDTPVLSSTIAGESVGFSALWHFVQGWNLEWEDPVRIVDSGLDFSIDLENVNYLSWFWQGPDGTADVYATVTLNAVPLPAPLLLLASGLIGLVGMRRKFKLR